MYISANQKGGADTLQVSIDPRRAGCMQCEWTAEHARRRKDLGATDMVGKNPKGLRGCMKSEIVAELSSATSQILDCETAQKG